MSIWPFVGVLSLLVLLGVWIYERLPRWRAADAHARREPLTEAQFGERFFPPDQAKLAARLRGIASEQLGKDLSQLHPDNALAPMLFDQSDSLDSVELLMAIEEEFGIELDEATAVNLQTFRDLVNAVDARRPFLVAWRQRMGRATEERFGVSLPREVLAKVATPGEFADAVAAALKEQVTAQKSCQNQRAFYLLRSAMMRTLNIPRSLITPATPLPTLIRWRTARSVWTQLRDAVAARQWPTLVRPRWMRWLVYGLPLLLGAGIALGLPWLRDWGFLQHSNLGFWVGLTSELRAWVVIPAVIVSWVLLVRVSTRFNWSFPRNMQTVGDLVPFVATSAEATWTREEIEHKIRDMVVVQLRVPAERYQAGRSFVEEFQMDGGLETGNVSARGS